MTDLLPENTYLADPALRSLLGAWLSPPARAWAEPQLRGMGRAAAAELQEWGDSCERQPAVLEQFDGWGNRVDAVIYPDSWRRIAGAAARAGLVGLPYEREALQRFGAQVRLVQAALAYLFAPSTATYLCPVAMTDGAARVLSDFGSTDQRVGVLTHLVSRDPQEAWTAGQWMTERQGGSDVGANTVVGQRADRGWRLVGQKFFCSNVGCEVALALARPEGNPPGTRGLALFLVPRRLPDGTLNTYRIDRLKDKLGTRAMATGEVTLEGAAAELVGAEDRGFAEMTGMLNITRVHNAITAAATMRRALMLASGYATQRSAFGRRLHAQPLHREILLDLAVQAEAAFVLTMRMTELLGRIENGPQPADTHEVFRIGVSLAKLYTAKQAVAVASEALECFGGQGYMEDTGLPRLLRDAQVLPIWEGTTSILSLDALGVLRRPDAREAFAAELQRIEAPGRDAVMDRAEALAREDADTVAREGRRVAFALAEAWIGGLLSQAAARGEREQIVADRWSSMVALPLAGRAGRQFHPSVSGDGFELVIGVAAPLEARAYGGLSGARGSGA